MCYFCLKQSLLKIIKMKKENQKEGKAKMTTGLQVLYTHAAGIDIGDTEHYVATPDGQGGHKVKCYDAFTCSLENIVKDLKAQNITTVAMESTGVYWLALYLMLEEAGIEPWLVNAKHVKNVTGRKKDDSDAIWIQKLHACGLLQKCFQPDEHYRTLRTYVRQRKNLITIGSDSVRRMQKAMELMNIKVQTVISDILGKTGMQMIGAILEGERNPELLANLTDPRIKASRETIVKSLHGIWKDEYLFMLQQAYDEYAFYQKQIRTCEEKIKQQLLQQVAMLHEGDISAVATPTKEVKKKGKKNQFHFPITPYLKELTGVDLCKIPGISDITAMEFISEIGVDMTKWSSIKHFPAWLNLVPNTKITGGKIISSKMQKKKNKAGQYLRMAASSLSNSKSPLGDEYRRMRAKLGGKGAVIAMAHKLARIIYTMIKTQTEYNAEIIANDQTEFRERKIKRLEKQLEKLKNVA